MRKHRNTRRNWRSDAAMTAVADAQLPSPRPNRALRRLWGLR